MAVTVAIVVGLFVVIMAPWGRELVEQLLQIQHATGLVLQRGHSAGRTRHEHASDPGTKAARFQFRTHFIGNIDDLAVTAGAEWDAAAVDCHVQSEVR